MRIKFMFLCIAVALASCNTPEKSNAVVGKRIEITPFIQTSVVLRDTAKIKNIYTQNDSGNISIYQYNRDYQTGISYLSQAQFDILKDEVKRMMHDPGTFTYISRFNEPAKAADFKNRFVMCDSIIEANFDASGKEIIRAIWACDSVSVFANINKIFFYESWYFNTVTKMIEKENLGYGLLEYDEVKNGYKDLFFVFKDQKTADLVEKKTNYY